VFKINEVQQKYKGGFSKGQLMDALDGLFVKESSDSQNRIVKNLLKEVCVSKPDYKKDVESIIQTTGWGISESNEPYPLRLQIRLLNSESEIVTTGINMSMKRYRDGDYSGAITSICGIIDKLTEAIYAEQELQNHKSDPFQTRVSNSILQYESDYKNFLNANGISDSDEKIKVWNNYKKSISNSAYVLGAFRREFSDVHGNIRSDLSANIVMNALDTANHIFASIINLKEKNFA